MKKWEIATMVAAVIVAVVNAFQVAILVYAFGPIGLISLILFTPLALKEALMLLEVQLDKQIGEK